MDKKWNLCPAVQSALYRCERRNKVRALDERRDRTRCAVAVAMEPMGPTLHTDMSKYYNPARWRTNEGSYDTPSGVVRDDASDKHMFAQAFPSESHSSELSGSTTSSLPRIEGQYINNKLKHMSEKKVTNKTEPLDKTQRIEQITNEIELLKPTTKIQWSWAVSKALMDRYKGTAYDFHARGEPMREWKYKSVPTHGRNQTSRMQEMFIAAALDSECNPTTHMFLKAVPIQEWKRQMTLEDVYQGEYISDGENIVMEASVLAFLTHFKSGIGPRLYGIVKIHSNRGNAPLRASDLYATGPVATHICIISELFGQDLRNYLERQDYAISSSAKKSLHRKAAELLSELHERGLSHLDFTPENILIRGNELRLCDFSKATPLYSNKLRHLESPNSKLKNRRLYKFESCQPTIGKLAYMPPECWKVYDLMNSSHISFPMVDLHRARYMNQRNRQCFYFDVAKADVYMLGILIFWISSGGSLWKYSDPERCNKYKTLVQNDLNFDSFATCSDWPTDLKSLLRTSLWPIPEQRYDDIHQIMDSPWIAGSN